MQITNISNRLIKSHVFKTAKSFFKIFFSSCTSTWCLAHHVRVLRCCWGTMILRRHWHLWLILRLHHLWSHTRSHTRSHAHSGCHLLGHALSHTWRRHLRLHLRLHHLWSHARSHTRSHSWIIRRCNHSRVVTGSASHSVSWRGHSLSRRRHHRGTSTIGIRWLVQSCEVHGCWLRNILRYRSIRATNSSRRWNALSKTVSSESLT